MSVEFWLSYKIFNFSTNHPLLFNRLLKPATTKKACANLLFKLQDSQDPEKLIEISHKAFRNYLPITNLILVTEHQNCLLKKSKQDVHNIKITLSEENHQLGILEFDFEHRLTKAQQHLLTKLVSVIVKPLKNAIIFQKMKKLAFKDSLTELANRNKFEHCFNDAVTTFKKTNVHFSLLVIDLDGFKSINDKYGHQTGDLVLKSFAKELYQFSSERAKVFRFGGDEFTILISNADKAFISYFAIGIKNTILKNTLLSKFKISTSIGSAQYRSSDDLVSLFERADQALYRAKDKGRNCLELSSCNEVS